MTCVRKKSFGIPLPFGRDLRQQQPSTPSLADDQAVTTDFDFARSRNRFERAEQRQLDLDAWNLLNGDSRKPWILARGTYGAARNHAAERLVGFNVPDAAAQVALRMQAHECPAVNRERAGQRHSDSRRMSRVTDDGLPRDPQEQATIVFRGQCAEPSCAAGNRPSAAATYPTTDDLSPETSPESA